MSKRIVIAAALLISLALTALPAYAQGGILPKATGAGCEVGDANYCGNYRLDDFISLAINVSKWILGIVGSLSLVMFIYGGFTFLISAGSAEKVAQANKIILAAVIGLVIVFSSYLIIQFALKSIGLSWSGQVEKPELYNQQNTPSVNVNTGQNVDAPALPNISNCEAEKNFCINGCNTREYNACLSGITCSPVMLDCDYQFQYDRCGNERSNCVNGCSSIPGC